MLEPDSARALQMVAVEGASAATVGARLGMNVDEIQTALVRSLRSVGATRPTDEDQRVAAYLFSDLPVAERDAMARALWDDGVDPADLHRLEVTLEQLRRVSKRTWKDATSSSDQAIEGHAVAGMK